jgi:hypothetical protein
LPPTLKRVGRQPGRCRWAGQSCQSRADRGRLPHPSPQGALLLSCGRSFSQQAVERVQYNNVCFYSSNVAVQPVEHQELPPGPLLRSLSAPLRLPAQMMQIAGWRPMNSRNRRWWVQQAAAAACCKHPHSSQGAPLGALPLPALRTGLLSTLMAASHCGMAGRLRATCTQHRGKGFHTCSFNAYMEPQAPSPRLDSHSQPPQQH